MCEHIAAVERGGRQKGNQERASQLHFLPSCNKPCTIHTAPPHISMEEVARSTCPICRDLLEPPVTLTQCQMTVCCMCLVRWLEASQDLKCPCCYSDHLRDFSTIKSRSSTLQVAAGYSNGKSTSTPIQQSTEQGKLPAAEQNLLWGISWTRDWMCP